MIKVYLAELGKKHPIISAQHAGRECYQASNPPLTTEYTSKLPVESALHNSGHHTTLEHADHYFTFQIEGISVADITLGLHLVGTLYNTSQRSGRYCANMFENPEIDGMLEYVRQLWPQTTAEAMEKIEAYLRQGFDLYNDNLAKATVIAEQKIKFERLYASAKTDYRKLAQEQMRMFVPMIFPTGLVFTVNLPTLESLYKVVWLPGMRTAVNLMKEELLKKYPELAFMFPSLPETTLINPCFAKIFGTEFSQPTMIATSPSVVLKSVSGELLVPEAGTEHPVNLMPFLLELMNNNLFQLKTEVMISLATMGQDQRHRTVKRSLPRFQSSFYLPPLLQELGLAGQAKDLFDTWRGLAKDIPQDLLACLAPYGAMVKYQKMADGNAFLHEGGKRGCFAAQEEIYQLFRLLREQLIANGSLSDEALRAISPKCVFSGQCAEGNRYCGRDFSVIKNEPFPLRKV